jgi:hypothetical protein
MRAKGLAWLLAVLLVVSATGGGGCGGRYRWTVLKTSGPPSALAGAGRISVSFNYSQMLVAGVSEAAFVQQRIAREGPSFDERWRAMKVAFERAFVEGMNSEWSGGTEVSFPRRTGVGLVVVPTAFGGGWFNYGMLNRSETMMHAKMGWIVGGQAVEELLMSERSTPTIFLASVRDRAGSIGNTMGEKAGRYLSSRQ